MKHINISKIFLIIGVFLLCTFIYYPRNEIIEVKLADIEENDDINTTINYPFEIRWDDEGFTSNRPSSVTYNLYNVLDENTIVSTVTLTSANVDSNDSNKWNGVFNNVRKYNNDESKAEYIIKQQEINNYVQRYDKLNYNALCIDMDTSSYQSNRIYLPYYNYEDNKYYYLASNSYQSYFYGYEFFMRKICVPVKKSDPVINIFSSSPELRIKKIYPSNQSSFNYSTETWYASSNYALFTGDEVPNNIDYGHNIAYSKYIFQPIKSNFGGSDIITNEINIKKYPFEHYFSGDVIPDSVKYNVYNQNNELIKSKDVFNIADRLDENNKLVDSFDDLPKYDLNLNEQVYSIKIEYENKSFTTSYDLMNDYNGICVEFDDIPQERTEHLSLIMSTNGSDYYYALNDIDKSYSEDFVKNTLSNKTVCGKTSMDQSDVYLLNMYQVNVKNIYPIYKNHYTMSQSRYYYQLDAMDCEGDTLPVYDGNHFNTHYTWKPNKRSFPGTNKFTTTQEKRDVEFKKYWEDAENTQYRPLSSEFYIYNKKDKNTIIKSLTLTSDNSSPDDPNLWIGTFEQLPIYDEDTGNKIEYVIRERPIDNYRHFYDSEQGVRILFDERTDLAYDNSAYLFYVDTNKNTYSYYVGGIQTLGTRTFSPEGLLLDKDSNNNLKMIGISYQYIENYLQGLGGGSYYNRTTYNSIINSYGNTYPESIHPIPYDDYYFWHYKTTPTNHGQEIYLVYHGDSWGDTYGLKINSIELIGDELIITSKLNLKEIEITKKWEDDDYESIRPTSVKLSIYKDKELSGFVKDIIISQSDSVDDKTWKKVINDLPKYNDDGSEIIYYIKENKLDNYLTIYDKDEDYYNGISVTFSEDSNYILSLCYYQLSNDNFACNNSGFFETSLKTDPNAGKPLASRVINFPTREAFFVFNMTGAYYMPEGVQAHIVNIEPIHINRLNRTTTRIFNKNYVNNHKYTDYLDTNNLDTQYISRNNVWHYVWEGSFTPLADDVIITNKIDYKKIKVDKYWEDKGHETERQTIKLKIYDEEDENFKPIIKIIDNYEIDANDNYHWSFEITGLKKYKDNGEEIKYTIEEIEQGNYITRYDLKDKTGVELSFSDVPNNNILYLENIVNGSYAMFMYMTDWMLHGYELNNNTFYVPFVNDKIFIRNFNYENKNIEIKAIPISTSETPFTYEVQSSMFNLKDCVDKKITKYINLNQSKRYALEWEPYTTPFPNDNIIINEYNLKNVDITKKWEDVGYESGRPETITFNLYNIRDEDEIVLSTILTKDNQNTDNEYEWNGSFENVPKYNEDGSIAEYKVVEEVLEKYKTDYQNEYNGLCLKFGDNVLSGTTYIRILFYVKNPLDPNYYYELYNPNNYYYNYFNRDNLVNKEICLPVIENTSDFYIVYDQNYGTRTINFDITEIKRGYKENYQYGADYNKKSKSELTANGFTTISDETIESSTNKTIHYIWKGDNLYGKYIVTNTANMRNEGYIKEFNDEGYENNRPKELVFGLYVDNDPVPKEMTTLHTSTCINGKCNIEFKYVKDKDSDGNLINYTIKEISDYGYTVTYQDDKVINTAHPVDVKFRKENLGHDILRGAKFEIYNKFSDKITEFTSKDSETTIKLLPREYILKEIEAPKGYSRSKDIEFTVNENGTVELDGKTENVVNIVNEPLKEKYDITIKKTLKTNETKDFVFEISIENFNGKLEYVGDRGGVLEFINNKAKVNIGYNQSITIKDIPVGSKYEIKELGYDYIISVVGNNKGTLDRNETIEFINYPKEIPADGEEQKEEKIVPTPITGIINIGKYILGIILLLNILMLFIFRKRIFKKEIN